MLTLHTKHRQKALGLGNVHVYLIKRSTLHLQEISNLKVWHFQNAANCYHITVANGWLDALAVRHNASANGTLSSDVQNVSCFDTV